jgi:Kef-type K+ transport system membrane component KefB
VHLNFTFEGAFEVGCMIPKNDRLISNLNNKLEDVVAIVFLPLYFTFSGLKTEFGLLNDWESWGICLALLAIAVFIKSSSSFFGAKFIAKLTFKESVCFAILMQTKGLMALIVFNLGLDYGVISRKLFAASMFMVLISTLLTNPIVEWLFPAKVMNRIILAERGQSENIYSIIMDVCNPKYARTMVSISEALVQSRGSKSYR